MGRTKKFYAVRAGRSPGIYVNWTDCKAQIHKYRGAVYKGFGTRSEAERYLTTGSELPVAYANEEDVVPRSKRKRSAPSSPEDSQVKGRRAALSLSEARKLQSKGKQGALEDNGFELPISADVLYRLEFDGAARNNPGPAGIGAALLVDSSNAEVGNVCEFLGKATNNVAEYTALIRGLEAAASIGVKKIKVVGDSALVVNQVNGVWQVKNPGLQPLRSRVAELRGRFLQFSISHVYREHNKLADALSNEGIDTGGWKGLSTPKGLVQITVDEKSSASAPASGSRARPLKQMTMGAFVMGASQPPLKTMIGGSYAARRNNVFSCCLRLLPLSTAASAHEGAETREATAQQLEEERLEQEGATMTESRTLPQIAEGGSSLPASCLHQVLSNVGRGFNSEVHKRHGFFDHKVGFRMAVLSKGLHTTAWQMSRGPEPSRIAERQLVSGKSSVASFAKGCRFVRPAVSTRLLGFALPKLPRAVLLPAKMFCRFL